MYSSHPQLQYFQTLLCDRNIGSIIYRKTCAASNDSYISMYIPRNLSPKSKLGRSKIRLYNVECPQIDFTCVMSFIAQAVFTYQLKIHSLQV